MSGQQLFFLYVQAGLCVSDKYLWEHLSAEMQARWNLLADSLTDSLTKMK